MNICTNAPVFLFEPRNYYLNYIETVMIVEVEYCKKLNLNEI